MPVGKEGLWIFRRCAKVGKSRDVNEARTLEAEARTLEAEATNFFVAISFTSNYFLFPQNSATTRGRGQGSMPNIPGSNAERVTASPYILA